MPRYIIAVVDDLFFASKIRGTAEQAGVMVGFARSADGVREMVRQNSPSLIICDLHSRKIDPLELAKNLKVNAETQDIPVLGFCSHVQTELQEQAKQAGFDQVIPRSVFTKNLTQILQGST